MVASFIPLDINEVLHGVFAGISYRGVMRKVWYGEQIKGEALWFNFQEVPFFFLKRVEQVKAEVPENMILGGFVSTCQLRTWARFWLWLKKVSKIKVWR